MIGLLFLFYQVCFSILYLRFFAILSFFGYSFHDENHVIFHGVDSLNDKTAPCYLV